MAAKRSDIANTLHGDSMRKELERIANRVPESTKSTKVQSTVPCHVSNNAGPPSGSSSPQSSFVSAPMNVVEFHPVSCPGQNWLLNHPNGYSGMPHAQLAPMSEA